MFGVGSDKRKKGKFRKKIKTKLGSYLKILSYPRNNQLKFPKPISIIVSEPEMTDVTKMHLVPIS